MTRIQLLRRLVFTLLLAMPVLVVCGAENFVLSGDAADCGEWQPENVEMTVTIGGSTAENGPGEFDVQLVEGGASATVVFTNLGETGSVVSMFLDSPDDQTPVNVVGSIDTQATCVSNSSFAAVNLQATVLGLDASNGITGNTVQSADCGSGGQPIATFFADAFPLPFQSIGERCATQLDFEIEATDGGGFVTITIRELTDDFDGDGVASGYDVVEQDATRSVPLDLNEVALTGLAIHPWIVGSGIPLPDLSTAGIGLQRVDVLDVTSLADLEAGRALEEGPVVAADCTAGELPCPTLLQPDLSDVFEVDGAGTFYLIDDLFPGDDVLVPAVTRVLVHEEVDDLRLQMIDAPQPTGTLFDISPATDRLVFPEAALDTLALSFNAATGGSETAASLLLRGIALVSPLGRDGAPSDSTFELVGTPGVEVFHLPSDATTLTPLSAGVPAPEPGGHVLLVASQTDEDASGTIESDERRPVLTNVVLDGTRDVFDETIPITPGILMLAAARPDRDCGFIGQGGRRPNDVCITDQYDPVNATGRTRLYELIGMGCPGPLAANEVCGRLDLFALGGFRDVTHKLVPEDRQLGCNNAEGLQLGGLSCLDNSGFSSAVPGTCAIVGGEGCPDACANLGGACRGFGADQYCVTPGFSTCTDLSASNLCNPNEYCRPYTLGRPGILALPKLDASEGCPSTAVVGPDGDCAPETPCDTTGAGPACGSDEVCQAIPDPSDPLSTEGRCVRVDTVECPSDLWCDDGGQSDARCVRDLDTSALTPPPPPSGVCDAPSNEICQIDLDCDSGECIDLAGRETGVCLTAGIETCSGDDAGGACISDCIAIEGAPGEYGQCITPVGLGVD